MHLTAQKGEKPSSSLWSGRQGRSQAAWGMDRAGRPGSRQASGVCVPSGVFGALAGPGPELIGSKRPRKEIGV